MAVYGGDDGLFDINPQGYMDMLAFQDSDDASLFDLLLQPQMSLISPVTALTELVNTPTTNSCSISSSSAGNDCGLQENNSNSKSDDHHQQLLKMKKKNPKKQKEARFAFMTRTEVDHLDDGYRWRKYGQKAVKNSPFPRSYYRCTSAACGVKKMVERSSEDPSTVVTTYEGTHIHPCPRGTLTETDTYSGGVSSRQQNYQQPFFYNQTNCLSFDNTITSPSSYSHYPSPLPSSLFRDHGLLHDMLSFQVRREEPS